MRKRIALLMSLICVTTSIAPGYVNATEMQISDSTTVSWQSKIDDKIYEVAERSDEKIPVVVWYEDVDQSLIDEEVEKKTGLTLENLSIIPKGDQEKSLDVDISLRKLEKQRTDT